MPNGEVTTNELFEIMVFMKDNMVTKDDAQNFLTRDDAKNFLTKDDAKNFLTKDDAKAFATKDDLKAFATKDDLKAFATKDDLKAFATKDDVFSLRMDVEMSFDGFREEMHTMKNELIDHIDGLVKISNTHEIEIAALRNRCGRIERHVGMS